MKHKFSPDSVSRELEQLSDIDLLRAHYCYQIGSTFVACALLEDSVVTSMLICDEVKIAHVLGADLSKWEELVVKQKHLHASTLGSLISLLAKHGILPSDLAYLRWLKSKRDFFVHRFFQTGPWPGDLDEQQIDGVCRTLGALEIIFRRGAERIIPIFGRAKLITLQNVAGGYLAINNSLFDDLGDL